MKYFLCSVEHKMDIYGIVLGFVLSIGSILTYLPQFHKIVVTGAVTGISEASLVILNMALMCLTMNSLIYTWNRFTFPEVLPLVQIGISWVMVLVYYIIFLVYKFKKNKKMKKRLLSGLYYMFTYVVFIILVISLSLGEHLEDNKKFFIVYADVLGYASAIGNGIVYLPQIYTLWKNKDVGSVSLFMYALQTPGNLLIIFFQAVLAGAPLSTWITYVVVFIEQLVIVFQLIYYSYFYTRNEEYNMSEI